MTVYRTTLDSPIGTLTLLANDEALLGVHFPGDDSPARVEAVDGAGHAVIERARAQLAEYFAGRRTAFDLPLAPEGTPMQKEVWRALLQIPHGETRSYGDLARAVGRPGAARAVGAANGRNPIAVIIPCHRVIGSDGTLTGYGGGLPRKEWLLRHEGSRLL